LSRGGDMPDKEVGKATAAGDSGATAGETADVDHEVEDRQAAGHQDIRRPVGITPVTVVLLIIFIISAVVLIGVLSLSVLRDYFQGEGTLWFLRGGLLVMIASILVYFVLRERSNSKYTEKLLERTTETNKRLRLLLEAERDMGSSLDLEATLDHALQYALEITNADMGAVYLWDKEEDCMVLALAGGLDWQQMEAERIKIGEGLPGRAAADRSLLAVDDASALSVEDNVFAGAATPASQVMLPLVAGVKLVGILITGHEKPHKYGEDEQEMLEGLSELAGISLTNAELFRISRKSLEAVAQQRGVAGIVLQGMPVGVVTADSDGRISVFNHRAEELTGYLLEEVKDAALQEDASLEKSFLGPLEHVMLGFLKDPFSFNADGQVVIMRKDKSLLPISYRMNALMSGSDLQGVTAVFMEREEPPEEPTSAGEVDFQTVLRSLGSRIERLYTQPLSRVIEQVRLMDIEDWTRSRDDMVRVLEAGAGALTGLLEDVEQYLNCNVTREWDQPAEVDIEPLVAEAIEKVLNTPRGRRGNRSGQA
jgi:putative methionine-R-sulfoxide reductase with GAF domain